MKVILPVAGKGEFLLTDALQMMIEQGCKFQIWAARHNSAVALYVAEPFRRQGDAPPLTTRSLLRNMREGNAAKVCAPRGHDRYRGSCDVAAECRIQCIFARKNKNAKKRLEKSKAIFSNSVSLYYGVKCSRTGLVNAAFDDD